MIDEVRHLITTVIIMFMFNGEFMEWQNFSRPPSNHNTRATFSPTCLNIKFNLYFIPFPSFHLSFSFHPRFESTQMGVNSATHARLNFNCFTLQQLNTISQLQRSAVCTTESVWKKHSLALNFQCKLSFKTSPFLNPSCGGFNWIPFFFSLFRDSWVE